jgi:hypothetical protein
MSVEFYLLLSEKSVLNFSLSGALKEVKMEVLQRKANLALTVAAFVFVTAFVFGYLG